MKSSSLLAIAVLLACCAALAAETGSDFAYVAESFAVDESSEEITVTGMMLQVGKSAHLVAQEASYRVGAKPAPRVVDLNSVQIKAGEQVVASADTAVFYPELQILTTDAYRVNRAPAQTVRDRRYQPGQREVLESRIGLMDLETYTCRDGQMYLNDEPIGGNSTCVNFYGGGSHSLSCSEGGGGNYVTVVFSDQACPIE